MTNAAVAVYDVAVAVPPPEARKKGHGGGAAAAVVHTDEPLLLGCTWRGKCNIPGINIH